MSARREPDEDSAAPEAEAATPGAAKTFEDYHGLGTLKGVKLRYRGTGGRIKEAKRASRIPRLLRKEVWIEGGPLNDPPEGAVWVADLTDLKAGSWLAKAASEADYRAGLPVDTALKPVVTVSRDTPNGSRKRGPVNAGKVVVYKTAWCGACKMLTKQLDAEGVGYVAKDVEKSPGAVAELQSKCASGGVPWRGSVPVTDWNGQIVQGYAPARFAALIQRARN